MILIKPAEDALLIRFKSQMKLFAGRNNTRVDGGTYAWAVPRGEADMYTLKSITTHEVISDYFATAGMIETPGEFSKFFEVLR